MRAQKKKPSIRRDPTRVLFTRASSHRSTIVVVGRETAFDASELDGVR